jgi:hypothetical protein
MRHNPKKHTLSTLRRLHFMVDLEDLAMQGVQERLAYHAAIGLLASTHDRISQCAPHDDWRPCGIRTFDAHALKSASCPCDAGQPPDDDCGPRAYRPIVSTAPCAFLRGPVSSSVQNIHIEGAHISLKTHVPLMTMRRSWSRASSLLTNILHRA